MPLDQTLNQISIDNPMTGTLEMNGQVIDGLADPSDDF